MTSSLRYRAVLFDLDGTLVDSYAALAEAVNHARRTHGLGDLPEGRVRDFVGNGMETLLQRAFDRPSVPSTVIDAFEARYDEVCCSASRVLDDVHTTIEQLAGLDVTMAVCTNKPTGFSRKILDYFDLAKHFGAIVGPDLAGARKPDGRHVTATLEAVGAAPSSTLFVGDMPIDVNAARNGGVDVAVVTTGSSTPEELQAARPDHFLRRFADLVGVVRNGGV